MYYAFQLCILCCCITSGSRLISDECRDLIDMGSVTNLLRHGIALQYNPCYNDHAYNDILDIAIFFPTPI
jgi:hypothetical protein